MGLNRNELAPSHSKSHLRRFCRLVAFCGATALFGISSQAQEQSATLQSATGKQSRIVQAFAAQAVPVGGILADEFSLVDVQQLDINLRANRVIISYDLTNPGTEAIKQALKFPFPRITNELVRNDPILSRSRQLNFLRIQIRSNGERVDLTPSYRLFVDEQDVTPEGVLNAAGSSLGELMSRLTAVADLPNDLANRRNETELSLDLKWVETFQPGETKRITLSYRPYSGFFFFRDLQALGSNQMALRNWRDRLDASFCINSFENADSNELIARADPTGWVQTIVLNFDENHSWGRPIETVTLTIDPAIYDNNNKRIDKLQAYPSFCNRQAEGFDPENVVRRSWQNVDVKNPIPVLLTFSPEYDAFDQMSTLIAGSRLLSSESCEPANGWVLPCSDMRPLSVSDIQHLSPRALYLAQLEILARKGAYFSDPSVRRHFERFSWYEPFVKNPSLSEIEQENSRRLRNYRLQLTQGIEISDN